MRYGYAIPSLLFAAPVYAEGLSAAEVQNVSIYRQSYQQECSRDNWQESAKCREKNIIHDYPAIAERHGETLRLKLIEGEKIYTNTFQNEHDASGSAFHIVGYIKAIDVILVWEQYYEGGQQWMIERQNGRVSKLLGNFVANSTMIFSPDGNSMLDYNYDESSYTASGGQVFYYDRTKGFSAPHDLKDCFDIENLKPVGKIVGLYNLNMHWNSDSTVRIFPAITYDHSCELPRN